MDRKIDAGSALVAVAALLLVIALFLDWFGVGGSDISAWKAFEVLDLVLLAAAGAAVAAAFGALESRVLVGAAGVALFVVVSQLVQPPPAGQGADIEIGAWLALVAALGLVAGAALTSAQIAVTVDVRGRERRRRVATVDKRDGAGRGSGDGGVTGRSAASASATSPAHRATSRSEPGAELGRDPAAGGDSAAESAPAAGSTPATGPDPDPRSDAADAPTRVDDPFAPRRDRDATQAFTVPGDAEQ